MSLSRVITSWIEEEYFGERGDTRDDSKSENEGLWDENEQTLKLHDISLELHKSEAEEVEVVLV